MSKSKQEASRRYSIGYALSSKNQDTFILPSLLSLASSRGLDLVPIDPSLPLSSQSPSFHLILHKLYDDLWDSNLDAFSSQNPEVPIVDRPEFIKRLRDRISMLEFVAKLRISSTFEAASDPQISSYTIGIPNQIAIHNVATLIDPSIISHLRFPVIAKPLITDGSTGSHQLALVTHCNGLLKLSPPLVLQEFVNHSGVVFKVYVVGDYVQCVKRKSLPDVTDEKLAEFSEEGVVSFSQVSNTALVQDEAEKMQLEEAEMPPMSFINKIARELRSAMGLNLFNFDLIRDVRIRNHCLVIDINYFPGYEKMPGYEMVFTDFLLNTVHKKEKENRSNSLLVDDEKRELLCSDFGGRGKEEESVEWKEEESVECDPRN